MKKLKNELEFYKWDKPLEMTVTAEQGYLLNSLLRRWSIPCELQVVNFNDDGYSIYIKILLQELPREKTTELILDEMELYHFEIN